MRWIRYDIETVPQAEELLTSLLLELGIDSLQIEDDLPLSEDDRKKMFVDICPEPQKTGRATVTFYREETRPEEEAAFSARLEDVLRSRRDGTAGPLTVLKDYTADEDWINNWKQYFHPFNVGGLLIHPSWEVPAADVPGIRIAIDPGTAFGTGTHETTQLVLKALEKQVRPGDRVLDVGTGSGILAIAALKFGAGFVLGTDLDEMAVLSAGENAERNGIGRDCFRIVTANILDDTTLQKEACGMDIVAANILLPVILPLMKLAPSLLKDGGTFIASGLLAEQEEEVLQAVRDDPTWEKPSVSRQGEWIGLSVRKKQRGKESGSV